MRKILVAAILTMVAGVSKAACPNIAGTWECHRDVVADGGQVQTSTISMSVNSDGVEVLSDSGRSNLMDSNWHSESKSDLFSKYSCNVSGIPLKTEFTNNLSDPYGAGHFIGMSEWYPVPLENPTHLFLRSTFPAGGSAYPTWFGYICRKI